MDGQNDVALPVSPVTVAGPSGSSTAGMPAPPPPLAKKGGGTQPFRNAEVQKVVREALRSEPLPSRELRIEFESDLHRFVVKVLDKESGEVIRQIPMPEALAIEKNIREQLSRMVLEQRAFAVDQEV